MPRYRTVWNPETQEQVDIQFTPEEELARDEYEAQELVNRTREREAAALLAEARTRAITKIGQSTGLTDKEIEAVFDNL